MSNAMLGVRMYVPRPTVPMGSAAPVPIDY
jgi:hypothetical protein